MNLQARAKQFWQAMKFLGLHLNEKENFTSIVTPYLFRSYHNLNHIERCLVELEKLNLNEIEEAQLVIAIWFHDIVYDTQRVDNEIQSACYFVTHVTNYSKRKSQVNAAEIVDLILATRYNENDNIRKFTYLCQKMREIDLAGLLDPIESVLETDSLVREEFKNVMDTIWKINRRIFLERLASTEPFIMPDKNAKFVYNIKELISRRYS